MARIRRINSKVSPLIKLWTLRVLIPLGGHRAFLTKNCFHNDVLTHALGLEEWADLEYEAGFDHKAILQELKKLHRKSEKTSEAAKVPSILGQNIARLAIFLGLSDTECRVLEFAILLHSDKVLKNAAAQLGSLNAAEIHGVLANVLGLNEEEVRKTLYGAGALNRSGLLTFDPSEGDELLEMLKPLSDSFPVQMLATLIDPRDLLCDMVFPSAPAELEISDYAHIEDDVSVLLYYLKQSVEDERQGVNILLYGPPGTGKSHLAKILAKEMRCSLLEVASENREGSPVDGEQRLKTFAAAQTLFKRDDALILFDEVEDVFDDSGLASLLRSTGQTRKAWVNRTLENNPLPSIWISNSIACMDAAYLRRFDMVLELPIPPRRQRQKIIEKAGSGLLDAPAIGRLTESDMLAPAVVTRAASVVNSIKHKLGKKASSAVVERLISNTLRAQGHKPIQQQDANRLPEIYDAAFVNADCDIASLTEGMLMARSGRMCLYGPPGTGKTAYGRWLAEQLNAPILIRRASDLLSPFLGESEQKIAAAFRQADEDDAVLMIDEVDTFLQDRRGASRQWEVSMVNEMLTQMESFSGVFLVSTNLMSNLDQASLRRFDLKVKFDFLKPEQAWALLNRCCSCLGIPRPSEKLMPRLRQINKLTPGDFAVVLRQQRMRTFKTADEVLAVLLSECSLKEGPKGSIGFI